MKSILTIFLALLFFRVSAQDDSMLQRLLDSARTSPAVTKPAPVKRDSVKPVNTVTVKKDSSATMFISRDTTQKNKPVVFVADSLRRHDSVVSIAPVTTNSKISALSWQQDTAFMSLLKIPYLTKHTEATQREGNLRMAQTGRDFLFYALVGILLLVAVVRQLFPKYFAGLFGLMFEATFRQKQKREQLMQEKLPSLMMNILFILVVGLFIALLSYHYEWLHTGLWWMALYSVTILALVYMFKYLVIQFIGWVFNAHESASTYSFIVFLINKIIGIFLLPLLLLLAFSNGQIWDVTITVAASLVAILLAFRYIISLRIIRGALNINPLHFFIYLCAIEIMPMLIIYKVLFNLTGKSN